MNWIRYTKLNNNLYYLNTKTNEKVALLKRKHYWAITYTTKDERPSSHNTIASYPTKEQAIDYIRKYMGIHAE